MPPLPRPIRLGGEPCRDGWRPCRKCNNLQDQQRSGKPFENHLLALGDLFDSAVSTSAINCSIAGSAPTSACTGLDDNAASAIARILATMKLPPLSSAELLFLSKQASPRADKHSLSTVICCIAARMISSFRDYLRATRTTQTLSCPERQFFVSKHDNRRP